jgi:Carboxypeptidase regulatory-like domain
MTRPGTAALFRTAFALTFAAAAASLSCASKPSVPPGTVSGVAVDRSGHGLPGITVTIQTDSGKAIDTVVTSSDGSYLFPSVPPGRYQVLTLLSGFTTPSPLGAFVTSGQSTTLAPLLILAPGLGSGSIELVTPTPTP